MLRWICGVKAKDGILFEVLLTKLHLVDAIVELRTRRLRWFGHVKRSNELSSVMDMALPGKRSRRRPLKTFQACVEDDIKRCNLKGYDPLNREIWRSAVQYSRPAVLPPVGEFGQRAVLPYFMYDWSLPSFYKLVNKMVMNVCMYVCMYID